MALEVKTHDDFERRDSMITGVRSVHRYSGDLGVHFSEAGDKFVFATIPKNAKILGGTFASVGVDKNATPTLTMKVQLRFISAGTEKVLIATHTAGASSAEVFKNFDTMNDGMGEPYTTEDMYFEVESVATPATAATAAEVWGTILYMMDHDD